MTTDSTAWEGQWDFSLHHYTQTCSVAHQSPIQWVPGDLSLEVKQLGHEAGCLLQFSAEVKNAWTYTSTPQYIFTVWSLTKQWIHLHGVCDT